MTNRRTFGALLILVVLASSRALGQEIDDALWRSFLQWAEAVPAETFIGNGKKPAPVNALDLYREKLTGDGMSAGRVESILQLLQKRVAGFGTAEWSRLVYNNNYAAGVVKVYTEKPNTLVAEVAKSLSPGTALDVAMGQGRNAIYLAQLGWRVTGFDVAEQGLTVAANSAKRLGLTLDLVRASNEEFDWGTDRWDLIVITYSPMTGPIERSLRPGGVLVIESFLREPTPGAPPNPPPSIGPNDLLRKFPSLRVLRYEDTTATADWGGQPTRIVRLVARKDQ